MVNGWKKAPNRDMWSKTFCNSSNNIILTKRTHGRPGYYYKRDVNGHTVERRTFDSKPKAMVYANKEMTRLG